MINLRIEQITIDPTIQPRAQMDWLVVAEYADAMKSGAAFPPVVVFHDGVDYWLADGFHRVNAAKDYAGLTEFPADVRQGNKRDAAWFALSANKGHGLRRSNDDKKRVVEKALGDDEWREKSNYEIATHCGVDEKTVRNYRDSIYGNSVDRKPTQRKAKRNGKEYPMNTTNIGKPADPEPPAAALLESVDQESEELQPAQVVQSEIDLGRCEKCGSSYSDYHDGYTDTTPQGKTCNYMAFYGCANCRHWEEVFYTEDGVIVESNTGDDMPVSDDEDLTPEPAPRPGPATIESISRVTIINADAQYLSQVVTESVHLVVTSPPYNVGIDYGYAYVDDLSTYIPFITAVWRECFKVMVDGARIAVVVPFGVGRNPYIPFDCQIMQTLVDAGFTLRGRIVWDKNTTGNRTSWGSFRMSSNPSLRDTTEAIIVAHKGESKLEIPAEHKLHDDKGTYTAWLADADYFMALAQDHWVVAPESAQRVKHPAPFPVELVERLIKFYAYPGAHVVDPFAGSGTVGVAARNLGCDATLVEVSQAYCELAKERVK